MKTIWKFPLYLADVQTIEMPAGAKILSVQVQRDNLCLWALVDPDAAKEGTTILIYGTGHKITAANPEHIGTFQLSDGALVFHVFTNK